MKPYYTDDLVTLWLGDCRELTDWLTADVLVTDPPYGRKWEGCVFNGGRSREGIQGDDGSSMRDVALAAWGVRPGVVFTDLMLPLPDGTQQVLVYAKPPGAGFLSARGGFFRDVEAICLTGPWPVERPRRSGIIRTGARMGGGPAKRYGHPHAKPVDVMETLIAACPPRTIADPFAGSGSTLVAARNLGRHAVGVEVDERYCEKAARRLSQMTLAVPG